MFFYYLTLTLFKNNYSCNNICAYVLHKRHIPNKYN